MAKKPHKNIFPQLFDIKPMTRDGRIDVLKIIAVKREVNLRKEDGGEPRAEYERYVLQKKVVIHDESVERDNNDSRTNETISSDLHAELPSRDELLKEIEILGEGQSLRLPRKERHQGIREAVSSIIRHEPQITTKNYRISSFSRFYSILHSLVSSFSFSLFSFSISQRALLGIGVTFFILSLSVPVGALIQKGFSMKERITGHGLAAYEHLEKARTQISGLEFLGASQSFKEANREFLNARGSIGKFTSSFLNIFDFLPFSTPISSSNNLLAAGEHLSRAGEHITYGVAKFQGIASLEFHNTAVSSTRNEFPTDALITSRDEIRVARLELEKAQRALENVGIANLPDEIQSQARELKEKLPLLISGVDQFLHYSDALLLFLGHDNPRTYLLLFQNPSEIRATGGFIGSYGILKVDRGIITKFDVDDIYNLDGQLFEKVIPPRPIQSISTAWSMHDANWFFDFPESARHIMFFFEKAGGPTPDGVITLNTNILRELVELTGPINLPAYNLVLDSSNIVEELQEEIELTYDAQLNQPKKILMELGPLLLGRVTDLSVSQNGAFGEVLLASLNQKDVLMYSRDPRVQELILDLGWGGHVVDTPKDYLGVVHSNINGFKTDWVIHEEISHNAEVFAEGEIIDTVTIIRKHQGGNKEFYNKVNKDYLRVYVPRGSELIEVSGNTIEKYNPPTDYGKSKFSEDSTLSEIERTFHEDPKTGTHIFQESGKTVFGNWVFVSPGETVIITYRYKLPFRLRLDGHDESYSLYVQKQSGTSPNFRTAVQLPNFVTSSWTYPDSMKQEGNIFDVQQLLDTDLLTGIIFK